MAEAVQPVLQARLLGPVELSWDGQPVAVTRLLERALAARLALAAGSPVADGALARDLWGDAELNRPAERLRVLASRLRSALGPASDALTRSPAGYALAADAVDVRAAEAAMAQARRLGGPASRRRARTVTEQALALWRGDALSDVRTVPFAAAEGERLDTLRLDLDVERLSAGIDLDEGVALTLELDRLARAHPLHERLCCLLAVALYRAGQQAEALARLAQLRGRLADELGVDPAPATSATELRILRQDPDLMADSAETALPDPHLVTPASPFLGRDGETAALIDQLRAPGVVTLTGAPGTGKTRLALEVARRTQAAARPVAWVDLAPLRDPDAVLPAFATACGVEAGAADAPARIADALGGALLVIDNAEHLVETVAAFVATLLPRARSLTVLVTSQRPLLISGEELHLLGPLAPEAAAAVFCARSGSTRDERVDAICAAVDRLPLGIELAAGLTRTLSLDQLARRIDDRLRLLVGGLRDSGVRHTSLRAALDWSYVLLDPPSQVVLRRLAVFAGGCTLEAAEQVVSDPMVGVADVDPMIRVADIAPALGDLAQRSLVTVTGQDDGTSRFGLLESVREYASFRLAEAGEAAPAARRHLDWCRMHAATHDVQGDDEPGALEKLFVEWPNLLAALESARGTDRAGDALRLALALDDAWNFRGLHRQSRRHYAALIEAPDLTPGERARGLSNYGFASALAGETDLAAELLDQASREAEDADEPELRMRVLYHRGVALVEGGRPVEAIAPLLASEALAHELGRDRSVAAIRDVRATATLYSGNPAEALTLHTASNAMDRAACHTHGLVRGLVNEAASRLAIGDLAGALECAHEGAGYARQMQDLVAEATLRQACGNVAAARGELAEAAAHFKAALTQLGEDEIDTNLCRLDLADVLVRLGEREPARLRVERALSDARDHGIAWLLAQPILASLAALDGDTRLAGELLHAAEVEYDARGFAWPLAMERMARAREALAAADRPR